MSLDFNDLFPLWERKLAQALHEPKPEGSARHDDLVAGSAHREPVFRNGRIVAQDIVGAIIAGPRHGER